MNTWNTRAALQPPASPGHDGGYAAEGDAGCCLHPRSTCPIHQGFYALSHRRCMARQPGHDRNEESHAHSHSKRHEHKIIAMSNRQS